MIAIACSKCGAKLRVPEEMAGRRGKCRKCGAVITVPVLAQPGADGKLTVPDTGVWPPGVMPPAQQAPQPSPAPAADTSAAAPAQPAAKTPPQPSPEAAPLAETISAPVPVGAETVEGAALDTIAMSSAAAEPAAKAEPQTKAKKLAQPLKPASASHEIVMALNRHIEPVPTSLAYKAAAVLVFLVMLLLPLAYVALIAGVGYAIYLHAAHDTWMLSAAPSGRAAAFMLVLYLAPMAVGAILILFMCKPLLARPARRDQPRSLTRRGEPLLFAFVEKLCEAVGAPTPRRIDVDCQVNASASFRRGWLSMLVGNDMVLTVGLPLVAGLNLREFAGVLAHEFGHFTQGWGMRLSYGIRRISFWFTRVVYERDVWDQRLIDWSNNSHWRLQIVFYIARACVWLTRKVLWVLMMIGHSVSGVLLRQMEFDADLHETRLAGSKAFESTCRRLAVLNVGTSGAYDDLSNWYRESRLCDDLPRLIVAKISQLPPEAQKQIDEQIDQSTTGWLDTHPADRERIARARQAGLPGLFRDERPATELFADFPALSKTVTFDFYKSVLGPAVQISDLHPTERLLARQQREDAGTRALGRYFQGTYHPLRPLPFPTGWFDAPKEPRATAARLRQARDRMIAGASEYGQMFQTYLQADTRLVESELASAMLAAGFKVKATAFSQPLTATPEVKRARTGSLERRSQTATALAPFEQAAVERITAAMELLHVPQVAAKLPQGQSLVERCRELLCAAVAIRGTIEPLVELRNVHRATTLLVEQVEGNEQNAELMGAIADHMKTLHRLIGEVRGRLNNVDYPFQHGKGNLSIAVYCAESTPASDDLVGMLNAASTILDRLPTLLTKLMGQLSLVAEMVETAIGLSRLEEPQAQASTATA